MLAGNEVLCTGTISIRNGALRGVSNLSGHYAPDTAALTAMLRDWRDSDGVDLDRVVVFARARGIKTYGRYFMAGDYTDRSGSPVMFRSMLARS